MDDNTTISLNAKAILEKTFVPHGNGYDPDEVDAFLDQIIRDYRAFEAYYKEAKEYTVSLETSLRNAKEKINKVEVENASYSSRLAGVKDTDEVNSTNIELINRIRRLETELFKRGADPNLIK